MSTNNIIKEERMKLLYDFAIEGTELTTNLLNSIGFTSYAINQLIKDNVIERTQVGHYIFKDINNLLDYYKRLISVKDFDRAYKCLDRCYELDSSNLGICFRIFVECIKNRNYERAIFIAPKLLETKNPYYIKDTNFYLYMLIFIADVPDTIKDKVKSFTLEDIKIIENDFRYVKTSDQNRVRALAFNQYFSKALDVYNETCLRSEIASPRNFLVRELLNQAVYLAKVRRQNIEDLVFNKKYKELITFLDNLDEKIGLITYDKYIRILANTIIEINNGKIPEIKEENCSNVFEAINANNFELALSYSKAHHNNKHNSDIFTILLDEITSLIHNLKFKKVEETVSFKELLEYLYKSNDLNIFLNKLSIYLKSINQSEKEIIIVNLFKLSILKKDLSYSLPLEALIALNNNTYDFDVNEYLTDFYLSINERNLEEAKIYLNIIECGNKLYNLGINIFQLDKLLVNENIDRVESYKEKGENTIDSKKAFRKEVRDLVSKKYAELLNMKGFIFVNIDDKSMTSEIIECASEYIDLEVYQINEDQIIFTYREVIVDKDYNNNLLFERSLLAMENHDYTSALNILLKIMAVDGASISVLYKIAFCYYYLHNNDRAIDYFTLANHLAKEHNKNCDFTGIILKLQQKDNNKSLNDEEKPFFELDESIFTSENNFYGINFISLHEKIMANNSDIKNTCESLKMSEEDICIVYLIYAREFYLRGNVRIGDTFIKAVEQVTNKTNRVLNILNEIRNGKKLYLQKNSTLDIELSLKLARTI